MLLLVAVVFGSRIMTTHRSHKPCDSASCYRNVKRPGAACCVEEHKRCKYRCFGHGKSITVVTNPSTQYKRRTVHKFTGFLGTCFLSGGVQESAKS